MAMAHIMCATTHALLLDINGQQAWVSRNQIKHKSINGNQIEFDDEVANKLVQPKPHQVIPKQYGTAYKKIHRVIDLAVLADELSFSGCLKITPKPNQPHQQSALDKLHNMRRFALFMQMRAGKTKVAVDLICNHFAHGRIGRVLWLCPNSARATAAYQWQQFAVCDVTCKIVALETISGCGNKRLVEIDSWVTEDCAIVIDESQMIKNARAKRSRRLDNWLKNAPVVGILSGTPITQNVQDLYNQAKSLDWRIFGYRNIYQFQAAHLVMSDKFVGLIRDTKDVAFLSDRLQPFVFEWFANYGTRMNDKVYIAPSEAQLQAMAQIKYAILSRMQNFTDRASDVYLLFTALQSVLSGRVSARTLTQVFGKPHKRDWLLPTPKLDALIEYTNTLNEQKIIWCTRRHELHSIAQRLPESIVISGEMSAEMRHERVQTFRASQNGTLVAMVQVAKRAIEMSECNEVIYYGHSFDFESREQSEWRTLLPNKTDICHYTDFLYQGTLDERIQQAHHKKRNVIKDFLDLLKQNRELAITEMDKL